MFDGINPQKHDFSIYAKRRTALLELLKTQYPKTKTGLVVLFAGFENDRYRFRQESSFYYLTGLDEPGIVFTIDFNNASTVYLPNCQVKRAQWMSRAVEISTKTAKELHIDEVELLGSECPGYQLHPFFDPKEYNHLIAVLKNVVKSNGTIFTLNPTTAHEYIEQRLILERLKEIDPSIQNSIEDISPLVATMRRKKDIREIEHLYRAIEITCMAQEAAAQALRPGASECEVQASLEYIFTASCVKPAFPSIVASGKNGTILHYATDKKELKEGELVIVDIGAEYKGYAADLTRTYPVSGTFTERQKELYNIVLETQEYIASIAKPGFWLSNKEKPEKSLNHLAKKYLAERGYGDYFVHGIGHFLGLDVHDVGDYKEPLQKGDVFTIEPGIYIPEEKIGIRIEDDYWMIEDGTICLSEQLPKSIEDIEKLAQNTF